VLIALIAFLAVAAGTACGFAAALSWRGWPAPLTAMPALAILDLALPGRHGFGARSGSA
jgi:hypothetical protein